MAPSNSGRKAPSKMPSIEEEQELPPSGRQPGSVAPTTPFESWPPPPPGFTVEESRRSFANQAAGLFPGPPPLPPPRGQQRGQQRGEFDMVTVHEISMLEPPPGFDAFDIRNFAAREAAKILSGSPGPSQSRSNTGESSISDLLSNPVEEANEANMKPLTVTPAMIKAAEEAIVTLLAHKSDEPLRTKELYAAAIALVRAGDKASVNIDYLTYGEAQNKAVAVFDAFHISTTGVPDNIPCTDGSPCRTHRIIGKEYDYEPRKLSESERFRPGKRAQLEGEFARLNRRIDILKTIQSHSMLPTTPLPQRVFANPGLPAPENKLEFIAHPLLPLSAPANHPRILLASQDFHKAPHVYLTLPDAIVTMLHGSVKGRLPAFLDVDGTAKFEWARHPAADARTGEIRRSGSQPGGGKSLQSMMLSVTREGANIVAGLSTSRGYHLAATFAICGDGSWRTKSVCAPHLAPGWHSGESAVTRVGRRIAINICVWRKWESCREYSVHVSVAEGKAGGEGEGTSEAEE